MHCEHWWDRRSVNWLMIFDVVSSCWEEDWGHLNGEFGSLGGNARQILLLTSFIHCSRWLYFLHWPELVGCQTFTAQRCTVSTCMFVLSLDFTRLALWMHRHLCCFPPSKGSEALSLGGATRGALWGGTKTPPSTSQSRDQTAEALHPISNEEFEWHSKNFQNDN